MVQQLLDQPLANSPKCQTAIHTHETGKENKNQEEAINEMNPVSGIEELYEMNPVSGIEELYEGDIYITRTFVAAEGKAEELRESLNDFAVVVKMMEPQLLKFQIFEDLEGNMVIMEAYACYTDSLNHVNTPWFFRHQQQLAENKLLAQVMETKCIQEVGGFVR